MVFSVVATSVVEVGAIWSRQLAAIVFEGVAVHVEVCFRPAFLALVSVCLVRFVPCVDYLR